MASISTSTGRAGSDAAFSAALHSVLTNPGETDDAGRLLAWSGEPQRAAALFDTAARLRDARVGRQLRSAAVISPLVPCEVVPACTYCPLDNACLVPLEAAMGALHVLSDLGVQHLYLNGGTRSAGLGERFFALVDQAVGLGMAPVLNFGPSFAKNDLCALRGTGIAAVVASTEVFDAALHARLKPGETQAARLALMDACETEGMPFETVALVGVGESLGDHVRQLQRLRGYRHLRRVSFSRFRPAAGTPMAESPRCSPWTVARLIAVARLMLPECEIALNMGTEADELPLWFAAGGGGGRLHAVTVSPRQEPHLAKGEGTRCDLAPNCIVIDRRPLFARVLGEMGAKLDSDWEGEYR